MRTHFCRRQKKENQMVKEQSDRVWSDVRVLSLTERCHFWHQNLSTANRGRGNLMSKPSRHKRRRRVPVVTFFCKFNRRCWGGFTRRRIALIDFTHYFELCCPGKHTIHHNRIVDLSWTNRHFIIGDFRDEMKCCANLLKPSLIIISWRKASISKQQIKTVYSAHQEQHSKHSSSGFKLH